jgi:putative YphP/YqiW family bacilliredoxin
MPYPEPFIAPMREELTRLGVHELRSAGDVDAAVAGTAGTLMIVVNSVCGCAAGKARPGVAIALGNSVRPDVVATVFAGADVEATDRARSYFTGHVPSSPSIALLQQGKLVYMLGRGQIENRDAHQIATELTTAFEKFCGTPSPA